MKKNIVVKQHDFRDCGACSLLSIIKYYDGYIPLEKIKLDTRTNSSGTTAYNILDAAHKYGFHTLGLKLEKLDDISIFPAIAHVALENGNNHFVVILSKNKRYVYLMDPAKGLVREDISVFLNKWTNIILLFKPYQTIPKFTNTNFLINFCLSIILNNKYIIIKLFIWSLSFIIISLISSFFYKVALATTSIDFYYLYSVIFLLLTILKVFSVLIKNKYEIILNKNIDSNLFISFLHHIFHLPFDVIRNKSSGEIITRIQELNQVKQLFSKVLLSLSIDLLLSIVSFVFLLYINSKLCLLLLILVFIYMSYGIIISPYIYRHINSNIDYETNFNSKTSEYVQGINSIKNLNITNSIINKLDISFFEYLHDSISLEKFLNKINFFKNLIYELGVFSITCFGILLVLKNTVSFINFITFYTIMIYFINPFLNLVDYMPNIYMIKLYLEKINELMGIDEVNYGNNNEFYNDDIIINNLTYSYNNYDNLINNLNISINKGERVLFKGESGIGKSTICQILNKDINNYKGNVRIGKIDIKDYSISTIRNNLIYVSQKETLFTDSILNNICLDKSYSIKELDEVSRITHINEILDKKEFRYNTLLLDGGINLSGGERQRIILARAIIRKPKILILDEALSEIDSLLEHDILDNLNKYLKNTTIIYVSHHNYIDGFRVISL